MQALNSFYFAYSV